MLNHVHFYIPLYIIKIDKVIRNLIVSVVKWGIIMSDEISPEELLAALTEDVAVSEVSTKITEVLKELSTINGNIEASVVSSAEGLPVAWYAKTPEILREEGKVAAAVTVIFSTSERNSMDLGRGHVDHIVVRTKSGNIILKLISEDYILAVVTDSDAKLGVILRDMIQASKKIIKIIEQYR